MYMLTTKRKVINIATIMKGISLQTMHQSYTFCITCANVLCTLYNDLVSVALHYLSDF